MGNGDENGTHALDKEREACGWDRENRVNQGHELLFCATLLHSSPHPFNYTTFLHISPYYFCYSTLLHTSLYHLHYTTLLHSSHFYYPPCTMLPFYVSLTALHSIHYTSIHLFSPTIVIMNQLQAWNSYLCVCYLSNDFINLNLNINN